MPQLMASNRRKITFIIAFIAGILLLVSGTHGPIGTYQLIREQLPNYISNPQIVQIVDVLTLILIAISLAGGLVVIAGGISVFMNHVSIGKLLIGLGTGIGIPWLILLLVTLFTTYQVSAIIAQYSALGWIGIILAVVARIIAK